MGVGDAVKELWYVYDRTGFNSPSVVVEMRVGRPLDARNAEWTPRNTRTSLPDLSCPWILTGLDVAAVEFRTHHELRVADLWARIRRQRLAPAGEELPPAA